MNAVLAVGFALTDARRARLRTALPGPDAGLHVAQALALDAPWRGWMQDFLPDAHASDDAVAAWRAVAYRLPSEAAQRLSERREARAAMRMQ